MEYSKEDLENKKIVDLKQILKNLNLRLVGNKQELIDRILDNQRLIPKSKPPIKTDSYLDILPNDISNMINNYRVENEPNNKISKDIISNVASYLGYRWSELNRLMENLRLPFKLMENEKPANSYYGPLFIIKEFPQIVTEETLISLILSLLKRELSSDNFINATLRNYHSNLRVDTEVARVSKKKNYYRYTVGYFKPIQSVEM